MEESFHMALCVVKIIALCVIASSLWSMSSGYGYASDFGTQAQAWDGSGSWGTGAGSYNVENSQAILQKGGFGNRYEPPVFWNIGDLETTEAFQQNKHNLGVVSYGDSGDAAPAKGYNTSVKIGRGYNTGVKTRGYATNVITPY
jgi:hypothetical protein